MRLALALALVVALVAAPAALAGGALRKLGPRIHEAPRLTEKRATAIFLRDDKVADWLSRFPPKPITDATFERRYGYWTVKVWSGKAGEVATGRVDDRAGVVTEAWTGPQVAWAMARGGKDGVFGGPKINSTWLWATLCLVFILGLADLRRPLSVRNLDLLALIAFSASWWYFNRGRIFLSVPLAYPPLLYLLGRTAWVGWRGRLAPFRPVWPVWVLAAAAVFLAGFRIGLNVRDSNVVDVGYSGVVGAERIVHGQAPYGHMPIEDGLKACGPADASGETRERIQTNGRCESANPRGDTYGPIAYLAYIPGWALLGWSGKWDDLPAAHFAAIAFDLLTLLGIALVGLRFGGPALGAALAFAWTAYPFTQYVLSSNTNDALVSALLVWSFLLVTTATARGAGLALAAWTKLAPLVLVPVWLSYPNLFSRAREKTRFLVAFVVATLAAFSILLLEPSVLHALRVFWDRTVAWQVGRHSPFSVWDWRQYHAGLPDLHLVQRVLQIALVGAALAAAFVPRRKSPLQVAALSAALLLGFELVLTHWFYFYLVWFFPLAAFALFSGRAPAEERRAAEVVERELEVRELVPTG